VSKRSEAGPWTGRRLHFIAIGGAGMSGLALIADRLGAEVTGSDRAESSYLERLRRAGLEPRVGHDAAQVPEGAAVVISSAIAEDNPELARAQERGQQIVHRGELLAEVCREKRLIAVAGAHGKTTTAGMIAFALRDAGADPAFLVGGELRGVGTGSSRGKDSSVGDGAASGKGTAADDGAASGEGTAAGDDALNGERTSAGEGTSNAAWGDGEWIVAEADESDGSFLELAPEIAVITNIELDHHSHWSSERELREAFDQFAAGARSVVIGEDPGSAGAPLAAASEPGSDRTQGQAGAENVAAAGNPASTEQAARIRFGIEGDSATGNRSQLDLAAVAVSTGVLGSTFTVRLPDGLELEVSLPIPGRHNVLNALAALAALYVVADGDRDQLAAFAASLGKFDGVVRRLERKGSRNGAEVFDDYAHHPTEVAAALATFTDPAPHRLIAVFQPHLYSRTKALANRFGQALAQADEIFVLEVYPAREEPVGELVGVSGRMVADAAADHAGGRPVWWLEDLDAAERALRSHLTEGDVLVTLGAGDVFELADRLVDSEPTAEANGQSHEKAVSGQNAAESAENTASADEATSDPE